MVDNNPAIALEIIRAVAKGGHYIDAFVVEMCGGTLAVHWEDRERPRINAMYSVKSVDEAVTRITHRCRGGY